jgi:hypothetical protein
MAVTADGQFAFICVWGEGVLAKVNLAALRDGAPENVHIADAIELGRTAHPYSASIDPAGERVWVANTQATRPSTSPTSTAPDSSPSTTIRSTGLTR